MLVHVGGVAQHLRADGLMGESLFPASLLPALKEFVRSARRLVWCLGRADSRH